MPKEHSRSAQVGWWPVCHLQVQPLVGSVARTHSPIRGAQPELAFSSVVLAGPRRSGEGCGRLGTSIPDRSGCALATPHPGPREPGGEGKVILTHGSAPPACSPRGRAAPGAAEWVTSRVSLARAGEGRDEDSAPEPRSVWRRRPLGLTENGFRAPKGSQATRVSFASRPPESRPPAQKFGPAPPAEGAERRRTSE